MCMGFNPLNFLSPHGTIGLFQHNIFIWFYLVWLLEFFSDIVVEISDRWDLSAITIFQKNYCAMFEIASIETTINQWCRGILIYDLVLTLFNSGSKKINNCNRAGFTRKSIYLPKKFNVTWFYYPLSSHSQQWTLIKTFSEPVITP